MRDLKYLSYPFSVIQPQKDALEIHLLTVDGFDLRTSAVLRMPIPLVTISNASRTLSSLVRISQNAVNRIYLLTTYYRLKIAKN